jgi:quinol monooxygenase YgiN
MIRSVIRFTALPGKRPEFLETFVRIGVLEISSFQPGFLGAQLHAKLDDPDVAMVTADWDSPAAYQGWLGNPVRATLSAELAPLLTADPQAGELFEVQHHVGPQTEPPAA